MDYQHLFLRPQQNTSQSMLDKFSVVELIEFERFCRDNARWDEMKKCFTRDSRVTISWFQGSGWDFVEASKKMTNPAPHKLYNTAVWLNGDRAVSLTMCTICTRVLLDGKPVDLTSDAKLLYRTRRVDGQWMIAGFEGIYEKDSLVPAFPTDGLKIPQEELAKYRPTYAALSLCLSRQGYAIDTNLPGIDRPDLIEKVYAEAEAWLAE